MDHSPRRIPALFLALFLLCGIFLPACAPGEEAPDPADFPGIAREIAAEGMVLLKNDGVLPLSGTVAVFGNAQILYQPGGGGSGSVSAPYTVSILQGLKNAEKEGAVSVFAPLADAYEAYIGSGAETEMPLDGETLALAAQKADTAVVCIARYSAEAEDRDPGEGDYLLSAEERELLRSVTGAFEKVAVVLNAGSVMDTEWLSDFPVGALLLAGQGGMEGGNAAADVLCGAVNPSGKLTATYARDYLCYPGAQSFGNTEYSDYEEDIFVGYRYFETFDPEYEQVSFPFGFGLSYTEFEIKTLDVKTEKEKITVRAKITNTGETAGKELVQVYFGGPAGSVLGYPAKQLAAFAKTKLLAPGKSQTVELSFPVSDMAAFDDTGKLAKSAYVLEAGEYPVYVGNSVRDAKAEGGYLQKETAVVRQLSALAAPTRLEKRLTASGVYESLTVVEPEPEVWTVLASGASKIEAEGFSDKSGIVGTYKYGGGICLFNTHQAGDWTEYLLDVEKAGSYSLVLSAARTSAAEDTIAITVNGVEQPGAVMNTEKTHDTDWYVFENTAAGVVELPEGRCVLRIRNKNGEMGNIECFYLQNAQEPFYLPADEQEPLPEEPAMSQGELDFGAVVKNPELMADFVAQLTNRELAEVLSGQGGLVPGATGAIGGQLSYYGVTAAETSDGPAGLRLAKEMTYWPSGSLLASSWNTELAELYGRCIGDEAVQNGVDVWLAPGMNLQRNPLCGRNFEYYSEDPLLSGRLAAAVTRGCQSRKVAVTLKHFAANNQEVNRTSVDIRVSERALRELYLRSFEIAVREADPWCIMTSYNLINGTEVSENRDILTGIARGEWGYAGIFMTDWFNDSSHVLETAAGNDVRMPNGQPEELLRALYSGKLDRADLELCAARLLTMVLKTNAYERGLSSSRVQKVGSEPVKVAAGAFVGKGGDAQLEQSKDESGDGYNLGFLYPESWIQYSLDVEKAGTYTFRPRISSYSGGGAFSILVNGVLAGTYENYDVTGDWQAWTDGAELSIELPEGRCELRLVIVRDGLNLGYFTLAP